MSPAVVLAFAAGSFGLLGASQLSGGRAVLERGPRFVRALAKLVDVVVRLGREGRDPAAAERRRLLLAGALLAAVGGTALVGPLGGAVLGAGGPWLVARLLRARREHYRRAVERESAGIAVGLADALGAGHSLRAALAEAADGLAGPAGHELRRVTAELHAGATTDDALEALRRRVASPRLDTVVAACLVQRRAGGDLSRLLRECADAFGDQARLEDEVRSATAQARFTGVVVVLLPAGGALLAELAAPGFVAGLWGSLLTAWLVGIAVALQVVAAVAIRRLGRVRW